VETSVGELDRLAKSFERPLRAAKRVPKTVDTYGEGAVASCRLPLPPGPPSLDTPPERAGNRLAWVGLPPRPTQGGMVGGRLSSFGPVWTPVTFKCPPGSGLWRRHTTSVGAWSALG